MRAVITTEKGGYTAVVNVFYGITPPPPEEHHKAIDNIHTIFQGMQTHSYELEGLAKANAVPTISNTAVPIVSFPLCWIW